VPKFTAFEVPSGAADTTAMYQHSSWPPNAGTFSDNNDAGVVFINKSIPAGTYTSTTGLFRFDTSAIPDTDEILSAWFEPYIVGPSFGDADDCFVVGKYQAWGGTPSDAADWLEVATPSIWTPVDMDDIILDRRASWGLNDLSGISKTAFTEIAVTLSSFTPTGYNEIHIREHVGAANYTRLVVLHGERDPLGVTRFPKFLPAGRRTV